MAVLIFSATMAHMVLVLGKMPSPAEHFHPPTSFGVINLIYSCAFAALGGWVCATIASHPKWKHGLTLAGLVTVLACISVYIDRGQQPIWYQICIVLLSGPATALGARVRTSRPSTAVAMHAR